MNTLGALNQNNHQPTNQLNKMHHLSMQQGQGQQPLGAPPGVSIGNMTNNNVANTGNNNNMGSAFPQYQQQQQQQQQQHRFMSNDGNESHLQFLGVQDLPINNNNNKNNNTGAGTTGGNNNNNGTNPNQASFQLQQLHHLQQQQQLNQQQQQQQQQQLNQQQQQQQQNNQHQLNQHQFQPQQQQHFPQQQDPQQQFPQQQQQQQQQQLQQQQPQQDQPSNIPHENDPEYHPHLQNPQLMDHANWELQMFLAMISRNMMGLDSNIYAIESVINAIRGNLGTENTTNSHTEVSNRLVNATKASLIELANSSNINKTGAGATPDETNGNGVSSSTGMALSGSNSLTLSPQSLPGTPNIEPTTPLFNHALQNSTAATGTTPVLHPGSILLQHKKLSLYNIDEDDDNNGVNNVDPSYDDQLWHCLDLSNLKLTCISGKLTHYGFLSRLYLNGNNITVIPKSIKNLSSLRVLDLSNNKISELPSELGMLYNLKYLYLFDNNIRTFPFEFGNLISLQFLGFEGNPIDPDLLKIYMDKSLTGLIFYLRDNAPKLEVSKEREFIEINGDGETTDMRFPNLESAIEHQPLKKNSFTLASYNTLCQHYATPKMYKYTPSWALNWLYRRAALKEEILNFKTDIVCLQEVEAKTYEDFWCPILKEKGYASMFHCKTRAKTMHSKDSKKVDGCCLFYKESEFKLLFSEVQDFSTLWMGHKDFHKTEDFFNRAMSKDNVVIYAKFQHMPSNETVWIVTTHLHWDPKLNDVKAFQTGILLDHLEKIIKEQSSASFSNNRDNLKKVPIIICGDFNSQKHSAVYELFQNGTVQNNHMDLHGRDYGLLTKKNFAHGFQFRSAYDCIGELAFTNYTPAFVDVIDYIWYSPDVLRVRGVLGDIDQDYASHFIGFPNDKFPSDHIPLISRFEFTGRSNEISSSANTNIGSYTDFSTFSHGHGNNGNGRSRRL